MNRLEFLHDLTLPDQNFASMVVNSFDKIMALYSIVGNYEGIHVSNDSNVNFNVSFDDSEKINQLQIIISQMDNRILIYGKQYTIIVNSISNKSISLTLQ